MSIEDIKEALVLHFEDPERAKMEKLSLEKPSSSSQAPVAVSLPLVHGHKVKRMDSAFDIKARRRGKLM